VAAVDEQLSRLLTESGSVAGLTRKLPDTQQEYLRLKRDVAVSQGIYTNMLNGAQQLKVAKAGTVGNVAVVDYAKKPKFPVRPKKGQIVGLAVLAGVFLGVLAAQVMAFMRSAVRDPSKLEAATGLSVFSIVPLSRAQEDAERSLKRRTDAVGLLAVKVPGDASIEALRSFRTGLQFATIDSPNRRVLITGPVPEIGKSFVSANFAAIMAQAGKRVVLIDGDMRKGTLTRYFADQHPGAKKPLGLSDVISAETTFEQALIKTELPNLDVLVSGTVPPNPSELLMHTRFLELLEKLDALYDYVIIDSPPVLLVSDASVIAQHCAATFVVARYGATNVRQIADSQKRLGQAGVRVNGLIFNGFMANRGAYYYGYKYGYGKYKDSYGAYGTYGSLPKKGQTA
jgi:tyrosine-protein kinase Etk/Wzc